MNKFSDTEIAYTAGIIDGEGCIFAYRPNPKTHSRNITIGVTVGITDMIIPCWLKAKYGGGLSEQAYSNKKWKSYATWGLTGPKCMTLLELLIPYLKIKKHQAYLAIECQLLQKTQGGSIKYKEGGPKKQEGYTQHKHFIFKH